jgi:dihydrofolate reductase
MAATVLYMSMSLDGFITGPNVRPNNGLGDGGERLHDWVFPDAEGGDFAAAEQRLVGANRQIYDEMMATGAVVAGRRTFEPARGWQGDHHHGVPIWILSRHRPPEWASHWPLVHYVDDITLAIAEAKRAAGDRNVLVHGSGIVQRALPAGLIDELEIHLVPVLMGAGTPLFAQLGLQQRSLQRLRVLPGERGVTHLRFRVERDLACA